MVSEIYPEIIKFMSSNDLEIKVMAYSYLSFFSEKRKDVAILCINTFRKDVMSSEPMVRILSISSFFQIQEFVPVYMESLNVLLKDKDPLVRIAAINSIKSLYYYSEEHCYSMTEKLESLISEDENNEVIILCLKILKLISTINLTNSIVLNLLSDSNLSHQSTDFILNVLYFYYSPVSLDETKNLISCLDRLLICTNSSIRLSTIKLLIKYSHNLWESEKEMIYKKIFSLISTLHSDSFCVSHPNDILDVILVHIDVFKSFLEKEYEDFLLLLLDNNNILLRKKLTILEKIICNDNVSNILEELFFKVYDSSIASEVLETINFIRKKFPETTKRVLEFLLPLMKLEGLKYHIMDYVCQIVDDESTTSSPYLSFFLPHIEYCFKESIGHPTHSNILYIIGKEFDKIPNANYMLQYSKQRFKHYDDVTKYAIFEICQNYSDFPREEWMM